MRALLILLPALLLHSYALAQFTYGEPEKYHSSAIVKVHVPAWEENGSGLLIGQEGSTAFVVTAAHVVADPDEDDSPLPPDVLVNVKVQEYNSEGREVGSEGTVTASVRYFDSRLDLAILAIDWSALPQSKNDAAMLPAATPLGLLSVEECIKGEMATLRGFSGGSQSRRDQIELMVQGAIYYGDEAAFRMEAENVEGGHSGAPVFNSLGEWIGLMVKRNGTGTACKVLKAATVLGVLQKEGISPNWLRQSVFHRSWQIAGMVERGNSDLRVFPPTLGPLHIDAFGRLSGLSEGIICINNATISFNGLPNNALMLLPAHTPGASSNLHRAVLEENRQYRLEKLYHPLFPDQLSSIKLICDQYELWLHPMP